MSKIKVGILNVTGYAGVELARLLSDHPGVELTSVTGRSAAGQPLGQVFPHLAALNLIVEAEIGEADLVFSALPHRESAEQILPLLTRGIKIIDVSADFRLKNSDQYEEWYGFQHPDPKLLAEAVYGLPELYRDSIKSANLTANPGCYPTASILALAPMLKAGLISGNIIIDAKSGVSGAGRSLNLRSHFCEANNDVSAYALTAHRHQPEITQELQSLSTEVKSVTFTPHLIPVNRGILATCYAPLNKIISDAEIHQIYTRFYDQEQFVRVTTTPPHTRDITGTNMCLVHPVIDRRSGLLIVISCIDNLIKGAAGQAIQNMNLMLGIPEETALPKLAQYP
ncbi:MAG: N-acetyl-gamma-glutamyl-phosphate reductase [Dehalogenimonas sp.]